MNESQSNISSQITGSQQKKLAPLGSPAASEAPTGTLRLLPHHLRESGISDLTISAAELYSVTNNVEKARRLWATILSKRLDNFSQRQLHQGLRRSFSPDEITDALETLVSRGYLRKIPSEAMGKVGRPASPVFQVNPLARTQNSGNNDNYGDSAYTQQMPQEQKVNNKVDEEPDTTCTQNTQNHQSGTKPEQEDEQVPDWF